MAGRRNIAKTNLIFSGPTSLTALKRGHQSPELRPRFQRRGLCFAVRSGCPDRFPRSPAVDWNSQDNRGSCCGRPAHRYIHALSWVSQSLPECVMTGPKRQTVVAPIDFWM